MSLRDSRRVVAFCLCLPCLAGPCSSASLVESPGVGASDRHAQNVANSMVADPQYGPAETLIVPLDFDEVDPETFAQALKAAGFARAEASRTSLADRPVKLIRATR